MAAAFALPASTDQLTVTARIEVATVPGAPAGEPSDAVVWLTPLDGNTQIAPLPRAHPQLVQKNKTFLPHLLVVPVGSSVEFPNRDPFFHNVFSLFNGKRFDLGLYEAGTTRSVVFSRAGISYIFCNIHPEMSAVVVALNTPFYGISDKKGTITISNVPSGRYEMQVWHERVLQDNLNGLKRTITIAQGSTSLGVIRLPEERSPLKDHKNKYGQDYDPTTPSTPGYIKPEL
jgi:plastocyanin